MLIFERPLALFLFIAYFIAIYLRYLWPHRGGRLIYPFHPWKGHITLSKNIFMSGTKLIIDLCFWIGMASLIVTLAGPVKTDREKVYLSQGVDIMIVLDESPSMAGKDFPPVNRFEAARQTIREFLLTRENDSFGLVSFGKNAALRIPPTRDYDLFKERLNSLQIMDLGDGSALGMGIALAALHLENTSGSNKVIILLTDGANNAGIIQPETAAEIAGRSGVRIYTIGIGTEGEIPIEFTNPKTGTLISAYSREGYDEDLLKKLANITGGEYFKAASPGTLNAIFKAIDSVETIQKRVKTKVHRETLHRQFLITALLLLGLYQLGSLIVLKEIL